MDAHRIKSLNVGKSKNRLRFVTSKQKSKRASADVYRKYKRRIGVTSSATREENVHHFRPSKRIRGEKDESTKDNEQEADVLSEKTTLSTELDLASDRNPSEIFGQCYRELWPLVRSLPEIIHHAELIVEIMLRYLLSPEEAPNQKSVAADLFDYESTQPKRYQVNLATAEIFHLLAVCAKDLRHEIHVWLHSRILPRIFVDLLNPPLSTSGKQSIPLDVTITEASFRAVAYLLRYDTEKLIEETNALKQKEQPCLEPMRKHYGATLTNRRPLIRQLAAQTFAPLIRKLKTEAARKRHLRRVLRALDASASENPSPAKSKLDADAVDGVALLCFEIAKGVAGEMHTKGAFVIDCVLNGVASQKDKDFPLSYRVASAFLSRLLGFLSKQNPRLLLSLNSHFVSYTNEKDSPLVGRECSISSLLRLTTEVLSFDNGAINIRGTASESIVSIAQNSRDWILEHGHSPVIEEWMARLLSASLNACQSDSQAVACLCDVLASLLGVGLSPGSTYLSSSSFRLNVAQHVFACLPVEQAFVRVGPLLLSAAEKVVDDSESIALIHCVACYRGDLVSHDDYISTLENADRCKVRVETVESLLDKVLMPCRELKKNARLLTAAANCAAFLAACHNDLGRSYVRTAKWLVELVILISEGESWRTCADLGLVLSSSIESLARLSLLIPGASGVGSNLNVKKQLGKAKAHVEQFLIANPKSINCLRSAALFCKALSCVEETLTDQSDSIFESLTPNLSCSSHFKRLHTLRILLTFPKKPFVTDHADLDLSDDLDEEPSSIKRIADSETAKGPVGTCRILELLLEIESLPIELTSERPMLSLMSRVEIIGRSGKLPILYAESVAAHLVGLLYWKFSPVWGAAVKTLALTAKQHDRDVWPSIFSKLQELMEHSLESPSTKDETNSLPPGFDLDFHFAGLKRYDSSDGRCFLPYNERVRLVNDAGNISRFESRQDSEALGSLWELFVREPSLLVGHSRDMVPLAIRFFRFEYFAAGDPDAEELFDYQKLDPSISTYEGKRRGRGLIRQNLSSILKVFSAVRGPEQLFMHSKLHQIFFALLGHFEPETSKMAFECILRYKPDFVMPCADDIKELFAKGKLRDTMIRLKEYANQGKITPRNREKLGPLLARILMGRMSARSVGKSTKDSPSARRSAIFSFVSGFCEQDKELFPFLFLPLRRYLPRVAKKRMLEDLKVVGPVEFKAALASISVEDCGSLPSVVHEGSLNVLEVIISQLGHRVETFVPSFMNIILSVLEAHSFKQNDEAPNLALGEGSPHRAGKLRSLCFLRLGEVFKKYTAFDLSPYSERLWKVIKQPILSLPQLTTSTDRAPALLKMLAIMSSHDAQRDILCKESIAIEQSFSCLSKSNSFSIVDTVLSLVDNLVESAIHDRTSVVYGAVVEHIPTLLKHFEIRLHTFGTTTSWKRELSILAQVCDVSKQKDSAELLSGELDSLTMLLLPFLDFKSRSTERDRINILDILESIIPNIQINTATLLFDTLSKLLGPFKTGPGCSDLSLRAKVASSLCTLSKYHLPQTQVVCQVARGLCSVNTKTIEEMDAETILTALKGLSTHKGQKSWIALFKGTNSRNNLLPVVRACFHLIHVEDGVIARGAFYALKDLVQEAPKIGDIVHDEKAASSSWEKFLEQHVVPAIRCGIACKVAAARRLFILLAAEACKVCKETESPYLLGDLSPVLCDDPDLDFFLNVTHVQLHRRTRALNRLRKQHLQDKEHKCSFSLQSISSILIPIALHPIYESKTKLEEPLAMEAIATLAALARQLPWKKYHDELCTLLVQVDRQAQQERYIIGAICGLLSGFHFEVGNPYSDGARNAVWNALEKRIIPKLEALFTKEKVGKSGEKIQMVRPQVILALTELYTNLPPEIIRNKLPRMLTVVCNAMKNRESDARDLARSTLSKLSVKVGLCYLPDIVRELAVTLREGYQLHVRAAALHSLLLEISESCSLDEGHKPVAAVSAFDSSISGIMDLIQQDLFGAAQARKDAEFSQVRYVKEAGGSKSLHSLELVASLLTMGSLGDGEGQSLSVHAVVSPLLSRIRLDSQSSKQLRQLKECLLRVVQGLSKNPTFSARNTLPLIYATIEPYISDDALSDLARSRRDSDDNIQKGCVVEWRPSSVDKPDSALEARQKQKRDEWIMRRVIDGRSAPKYTGSERQDTIGSSKQSLDEPSSVAAVVFGLQLLRHALRRDEVQQGDAPNLEPFMPLLTTCICTCRDSEAVLLALQCLVEIQRRCKETMPMDSSFHLLATKTLELLVGYGGNEDLLQASFKMMTFLIERGFETENTETERKVLDEEQLEVLMSFLQTSLSTTNQHNPAVGLIKALVGKRIVSAGMYDLMKVLLDQSVKSFKENLRHHAGGIYLRFLMNYPMTEDRLEREVKQLVANIQYEGVEGRQSAIAMVTSAIKKFPLQVVAKHSSLFFVGLTMQLGNEESDKGRKAVSESLDALLLKLPTGSVEPLFGYAMRWAEGNDVRLRRVSLSVIGLFVDSSDIVRRDDHYKRVLSVTKEALASLEHWELAYFSLRVIEKLLSRWPEKVMSDLELWPKVVQCLDGCHPWVTQVSLRIMSQHLESLNPDEFVENNQTTFLRQRGNLFELTKALCAMIDSALCPDDIEVTAKTFTWILKATSKNPQLCFAEDSDGSDSKNPVRWLVKRLSEIAKPKGTKRRENVFKCFAAFATYAADIALDYLELIIEPIYRVERESSHRNELASERNGASVDDVDEVTRLAMDLLHLLEQVCTPHEKFLDAYGAVKREAQDKKSQRQDQLVLEAARDPKAAAERKQKKQEREKARRKKRINERRQSRGRVAKRRHV